MIAYWLAIGSMPAQCAACRELETNAWPVQRSLLSRRASGRVGHLRDGLAPPMLTSPAGTFGELLRRYRQAAGLTQQELAERACLSVHGIQKLERGATHPYRDTAQRLIVALALDPDAETRFRAAVAPVRRHNSASRVDTSDGTVHNLPLSTTNLIGRGEDMKAVTARLANTRLLTLVGVGGCGKTRLALEVARAVVEHYADGVWLVELGPIADPAHVATRVAAVLGVRET